MCECPLKPHDKLFAQYILENIFIKYLNDINNNSITKIKSTINPTLSSSSWNEIEQCAEEIKKIKSDPELYVITNKFICSYKFQKDTKCTTCQKIRNIWFKL